ncbi:hypothetical protein FC42_GL000408 [Lactobacillus iners DSM 13335]|uniref:Uncharacterized protein n=1 Tax=Lactobacillus iners DSM 13335 TaxID=525328 RepID=C8PC60_9LACO|nr:hypothetical protein [Lactobacillus iners]EEW52359.1 hypothetical protein HMPREF0520_0680 [Lactobacillus iners DSM 13335]KRL59334.1 hypothetical protein FC42_GL000408 [Lactobacillus iners DSM 13335]QGA00761.1 hypothetical protein LI335_06450 [Lactobacillus iners]
MEKDKAKCVAKNCKTEFIKPSYHNKNDYEYIKQFLSVKFGIEINNNLKQQFGYYPIEPMAPFHENKEEFIRVEMTIASNEAPIKVKGWKVCLKKEPQDTFYRNFICKNKEGNRKKRCFVVKHFHRTMEIHRGHLLANKFKEFLVSKTDQDDHVNQFFGKGCVENIACQTNGANCDSTTIHGQWYFEDEVVKALNNGEVTKVFYEIYELSVQERSLGRVLLINSEPENVLSYFVFIPNSENSSK